MSSFRRFIEFPLAMEENVARQPVDVCLRADLGVHPVCYVAEVIENVEAVDNITYSQNNESGMSMSVSIDLVSSIVIF